MGSDRQAQNSILAYDLENGSLIRTYKLDVPVEQIDWESMSIGPCDPQNAKTCMYIGNMGNTNAELCINTSCTKGFSLGYIYKLEETDFEYTYHNAPLKVITLEIDLFEHSDLSFYFVLFYSRSSSETVADVLGGDACSFVADSYLHLNSAQFESITFSPFPYYAEANECPQGNPCSLHVYKRKLLFN